MSAILEKFWDKIGSHLHTMPGELRSIRRKARDESRKFRAERAKLHQYVLAVKSMRMEAVSKSVAEMGSNAHKGYVILLRAEMEMLFKELGNVIQEYNKIFQQLKNLRDEVSRTQMDAELKQKVLTSIAVFCQTLEKAFGQMLSSIAGIESFSLSSRLQGLLHKDTQIQVLQGETVKARQELKGWQRAFKAGMAELKDLERKHLSNDDLKKLAVLFGAKSGGNKFNLQGRLSEFLADINKMVSEIIALINQTHQELSHFKGVDGHKLPLQQLDDNNAPTWGTLTTPIEKGGYGYPAAGKQYEMVAKALDEAEAFYNDELKKKLMEIRLFESDIEHQMPAKPATVDFPMENVR